MIFDSNEQKEFIMKIVLAHTCTYGESMAIQAKHGQPIDSGLVVPIADQQVLLSKATNAPTPPPAPPGPPVPVNRQQRRAAEQAAKKDEKKNGNKAETEPETHEVLPGEPAEPEAKAG